MRKRENKKYLKGIIALSLISLSSTALADENSLKDTENLTPLQIAKQKSNKNLDPNSVKYQELLAQRELMLELNRMYNELENKYSLNNEMRNELLLPPEEIVKHRIKRQEIKKANSIRVTGPVKEIFDTRDLPMEQLKPIEVKIVPGYLSTITFFDSTGSPWPVEYAQPGNKTFSMSVAGEKGNIINLDTSEMYSDANASIGLVGQNSNYIIKLVANDKENTSKLSLRVPDRGPEASEIRINSRDIVENAPEEMYDIINGRVGSLKDAKNLSITGVEADGYKYNGFMYIVSRHTLLSPARENAISLPSGTTAYKIYPTSTLQFSVNGERVFATVKDYIDRR